ncbi:hypothetical protein BDQ17DRAFT_1426798 [Cyathus striatus]|nr:hypothetical protein BDQ17DRAFT_1426798 [Cyathus striatus]
MLVESQVLLGAGQVVLLATTITGSQFCSFVMYQVVGQLQVLTPLLLIYRVMQGKTYNSKTSVEIETLRFAARNDAHEVST